jgi:hypothetical protein
MHSFRTAAFAVLFAGATLSCASAATQSGNTAEVTIYRAASISANSTLQFGKIIRPTSGSGTVTISTAGARSAGGTNPPGLLTSTVGNADFTVTGEGGTSVTIAVDGSFNMSGPNSSSLAVTTTSTGTGSQSLGGSLGSQGSNLDVKVGGSITVTSTQQTGLYTGTFNVTAAYN